MFWNRFQACILLIVAATLGQIDAGEGAEGKRIALVVGNTAYLSAKPLTNAVNDARIFASFLKENGFEVDQLINVSRTDFAKGLSNFAKKINPEDTALFYFAGHGMQLKGENFLLGLDAKLESEFDVDAETISLNSVIEILERKAALSLLFVDACRDNPLADRLNVSVEGSTRGSALKGLAPVASTGAGTMIAFSASPGQVAYDGGGENSPFAIALVENLSSPSVEVGTAFKRVIRDVRLKTDNKQSPQMVSNIAAEFYFNTAAASATSSQLTLAQIDFEKAERISTARGWELFLAKHQSGSFADSARAALALLTNDDARLLSPKEGEDRLKLSQAQRKAIQLTLNDLGYHTDKPNGTFNQKTRRAIARYQKAMGLTETGYIDRVVANRLELVGVSSSDSVVSADEARLFDPDDLKGLETDERIIRAAQCLKGKEIIYGAFEGHLYVAVYERYVRMATALERAKACATNLVAIGSKAENDFVYGLFEQDDRMFIFGKDGNWSFKVGPWIGLVQDEGGREPRGGWRWTNGESLKFKNWAWWAPDEFRKDEDFVRFAAGQEGSRDLADADGRTWDDTPPHHEGNSYVLEFE